MRSPQLPTFLVLAVLASCAQDEAAQTPNTPQADSEVASTQASDVPAPATGESPVPRKPAPAKAAPTKAAPTKAAPPRPAPPRPAPPPLTINQVTASIVAASTAENEHGKQVAPPSEGAVAIDLQFASLPGRALDPVLEIGGVTFRNYETRPGGVLRFVVAGSDLAEAGAVVLRWGNDAVQVANQLRVTR